MKPQSLLYCLIPAFISPCCLYAIDSVKVINDTPRSIYVHQGGYAPSQRIAPGKWKNYPFPFTITPPNSQHQLLSNLLVATTGGRWQTTANGFTYLDKPKLVACLDYGKADKKNSIGKRTWTISSAEGHHKNCYIKGFRQLWWQAPY